MRKLEAYMGSAVWMAVSLVMIAAALEPVELRAEVRTAERLALAECADGSALLAMGCESIHL